MRIVIADDHPVVRMGLVAMLDTVDDLDVVADVASPAEAVESAVQHEPDVLLLDLAFGPAGTGVDALLAMRERGLSVPVLILTNHESERDILAAIEAGAAGYLLKDAAPDELVAGIRAAAAGESALAPRVAQRMVQRMRSPATSVTPRELEVLQLAAQGLTNAQIAAKLIVTEATVKSHLAHLFTKLDVASRTSAIHEARKRGML